LFLSFGFGLLGFHSSKPWTGEMKNAFNPTAPHDDRKGFYKKTFGGSRRVATTGEMNYYKS
jgi:hypothetical protein